MQRKPANKNFLFSVYSRDANSSVKRKRGQQNLEVKRWPRIFERVFIEGLGYVTLRFVVLLCCYIFFLVFVTYLRNLDKVLCVLGIALIALGCVVYLSSECNREVLPWLITLVHFGIVLVVGFVLHWFGTPIMFLMYFVIGCPILVDIVFLVVGVVFLMYTKVQDRKGYRSCPVRVDATVVRLYPVKYVDVLGHYEQCKLPVYQYEYKGVKYICLFPRLDVITSYSVGQHEVGRVARGRPKEFYVSTSNEYRLYFRMRGILFLVVGILLLVFDFVEWYSLFY